MEKINFDAKELENMVGKEFYLMVPSFEARKRFTERTIKSGASEEVIAETRDTAGILGEIESREPHRCVFNELEYLADITLENGQPLGSVISQKRSSEQYVFVLDKVEMNNNKNVVLKGRARIYKQCPNTLSEQEETFLIYFPHKPRGYKIKSGIRCTGT